MEQACHIPYSDKALQELKKLKHSISHRFPAKYIDSRPHGLMEEEVLKEVGNSDLKMTLKLGKNSASECPALFIRRIDGSFNDIHYLASNELRCLNSLDGSGVILETLFYFIELSAASPDQFCYVLVFQSSGSNLRNIPRNSKMFKVISKNLFKAYQTLRENLVYHGNLSLDSIFVDDSLSIRFYNFILGGFQTEFMHHSKKPKILYHFADSLYCSPEIILSINCYKNNLKAIEFDPVKSDLFSLGLVSLSLYADFDSLNHLQLDPQTACLINLKSYSKVEKTFLDNSKYLEMAWEAINQLTLRITNAVTAIPSKTIRYILKRLMQVYYNNRYLTLEKPEIKPVVAKGHQKNTDWFFPNPEDSSGDTIIKNILYNVCDFFSRASLDLNRIEGSVAKLHAELLEMNQIFQDEVRPLISIYEDQPCRSEINIAYGIAGAMSYIFLKFKSESQFQLFVDQLQGHQPNYTKHFYYFMAQTDEVAKDFIITSLMHSNFELYAELPFMFNKSAYIDLSYTSLSEFPDLCHQFESLLNCSFISSLITECSETSCDLISAFHGILPFCYLFKMKPRLCGVLSMNLRIFLTDYFKIQSHRRRISCDQAFGDYQAQAAVIIAMLHEFTNYLRRMPIQLRKEFHKVKATGSSEFSIADLEKIGDAEAF